MVSNSRIPFIVFRVPFMFYFKHDGKGRGTIIVLSSEIVVSRIDVCSF